MNYVKFFFAVISGNMMGEVLLNLFDYFSNRKDTSKKNEYNDIFFRKNFILLGFALSILFVLFYTI